MVDGRPSGLDRLLELRRRMEDARTVDLARARAAVVEADAVVRSLEDRRRAVERTLEEASDCSVGQVQSLRMVLDRVNAGLRNARTIRQAAETEADARTADFMVATRDREAVERVVKGRHEHARQLRQATEQKALDEAALQQFLANVRKTP